MRAILAPMAAFLTMAAVPAHALTEEQRDCPLALLPGSGFETELADGLLATETGAAAPLMDEVAKAVGDCAQRYRTPPEIGERWFTYTIGAVAMPVYAARLEQAGIPNKPILVALRVGPGQPDTPPEQITAADEQRLFAELAKAGVERSSLSSDEESLVGAYGAMAAFYYVGLARLGE